MTQLYKPKSLVREAKDKSLFSGVWICWSDLTRAERFVCANIVLLPVWWVVGLYDYMPELMLLSIVLYEWRCYGRLRLKRPSLAVVAYCASIIYGYVNLLLVSFDAHPFIDLALGTAVNPTGFIKTLLEFSYPILLWYIQSNNIRVRPAVVAWACSVSVVQMLVFWLVFQGIFSAPFYAPPRNLYGLLTNKPAVYEKLGNPSYLIPYRPGEVTSPGR